MKKRNMYLSLVLAVLIGISLTAFPHKSSSVDFDFIDGQLIGASEIDSNGVGVVYGDINLPKKDDKGRAITWTAADDSIVDAETGKILKYIVGGQLETSVTATIEGESETVTFKIQDVGKYPDEEPLFEECFDDEDSAFIATVSDGTAGIIDGVLVTEDKSTDKNAMTVIKGDFGEKKPKSEAALYEFDIVADESIGNFDLRLMGGSSIQVRFNMDFQNNEISGRGKDGSGSRISSGKPFRDDKASVSLLVNYKSDRYYLWVNGVLHMPSWHFYTGKDVNTSTGFEIHAGDDAGKSGKITLDNFRVYEVSATPLADITLGMINGSDSTEVKENLLLPSVDSTGTDINWESQNPNIRIEDEEGVITMGDESVTGKLIASCVRGGITYMKEFNLTVPKYVKTYSSAPYPEKDKNGKEIVAYYEDFSDITVEELKDAGILVEEDLSKGSTTIEKGKLVIRDEDQSHHRYDISAATSTIDDRLVIEFEAERSSVNGFRCLLTNMSTMLDYAYVQSMLTDGNIEIRNSEGPKILWDGYTRVNRPSKIAYMIHNDSTFSMWVDGVRYANRETTQYNCNNVQNILRINFRSSLAMGTLKLDNIRVYKGAVTEVEMVENIVEELEDENKILKKNKDGQLTAFEYTGENAHGCTFEYSSEKGLVESDGTIKFPEVDKKDVITVSVISPDGYTETKEFNVTIPANYTLGKVDHDLNSIGLLEGDNEFVIPAVSRGSEPDGGVSVETKIYDSSDKLIASEIHEGQYLGEDANYFVGVVNLAAKDIPDKPKVKITVFATASGETLKGGEFSIIGG